MINNATSISRRGFAKVLGASAAFAALEPAISKSAPVLRLVTGQPRGNEVVRLSSNENPYGPSPLALKAMTEAFNLVWRYPDESAEVLVEALARLHGVPARQILLGDGSGEILKLAAAAFTGPDRKLVVARPTFEAISNHARVARAETVTVNLTSDFRHDLNAMLDAGGALVYICNPNNPTASVTPKDEVRAFLAKAPAHSVVIVDEAYHHYVESSAYESVVPLIREYPNLMVARTFSKIYAMAGLRCGYCVAQPELIRRLRMHQTWDSVNILALVAATASLSDPKHADQSRTRNSETKTYLYSQLDKLGFKYVPSHANFFMVDLRREVRPVISALRQRNVEVGRVFPALPSHMRVTIGTRPQMESFVTAFRDVAV